MLTQQIPDYVAKYFWGDDLSQLDLQKNQKYIIETLLEKGDEKSLHWLLSHVDKHVITSYLPELKLSKKSENFWQYYFA